MKMPRLFAGWVTTDGRAHETKEAAVSAEIEAELTRIIQASHNALNRGAIYPASLPPYAVAELVMQHFHITPKVVTE